LGYPHARAIQFPRFGRGLLGGEGASGSNAHEFLHGGPEFGIGEMLGRVDVLREGPTRQAGENPPHDGGDENQIEFVPTLVLHDDLINAIC